MIFRGVDEKCSRTISSGPPAIRESTGWCGSPAAKPSATECIVLSELTSCCLSTNPKVAPGMKDGTLIGRFIDSVRNIQKHMSVEAGLPEGLALIDMHKTLEHSFVTTPAFAVLLLVFPCPLAHSMNTVVLPQNFVQSSPFVVCRRRTGADLPGV